MLVNLQSWLNYEELANNRQASELSPEEMGLVDHIMLSEREAIFCSTLHQVSETGATVLQYITHVQSKRKATFCVALPIQIA